jgi:hypothetical protein
MPQLKRPPSEAGLSRASDRGKPIPKQEITVLDLYTDATPNGLKISICLEELALQYNVHQLFLAGDQMTPEFTKLNPNHGACSNAGTMSSHRP